MSWLFEVQGLVTHAVSVGGLALLNFTDTYRHVDAAEMSAGGGRAGIDRSGLSSKVTLVCTDIAKVNEILAAATGDTVYSGRLSGTTSFHDYTVPGIVWHAMRINVPRTGDGKLTLNGTVRFADGTKKLADIFGAVLDASAPDITQPTVLHRAHGATFTPEAGAISPENVQGVDLSLAADIHEDYGDTDIGMTAVDRGDWKSLGASLSFSDYSIANGTDMASRLMDADRGVLTVSLNARAGVSDKTLTVNNLLWTGDSRRKEKHWVFTVDGGAGWQEDETVYKLNEVPKLFSIA